MKRKGIMIVVSGFSGAGKGTLMRKLLQTYDNYALSISMTTREKRPGEKEEVDYFFSTKEAFEEQIAQDGLIEYACYCGNYYGTPRAYVGKQLELGKDVILEIEVQGALKVKQKFPKSLLMFVTPPDIAELERRLIGRGTETAEVIQQRLLRAEEEAKWIEEYDFIVVNDDLERCVEEIHNLVQAAHNTPFRNEDFIENIRQELAVLSKGEK